MRVLIVEDDADIAEILRRMSIGSAPGLDVEAVHSGEAAMPRIEADDPPEVVVLDLHLPGMSGEDVFKAVRKRTDSKVMIVTADALAAPEYTSRADAVFVKPADLFEFVTKLVSLLAAAESGEVKS